MRVWGLVDVPLSPAFLAYIFHEKINRVIQEDEKYGPT